MANPIRYTASQRFWTVLIKQNKICRECGIAFEHGDDVVSSKTTRGRKHHYHARCAEKIKII
jgi:hypothetical protein